MLHKESIALVSYFTRAYPRRSLLMVLCLLFAGLLEGISIAAILPLLDVLMEGSASGGALSALVYRALGFLGWQPSLGVLLALMVVAMSLKSFALWVAMRQVGYTIAHVAAELRLALIRALMKVRWGYFSSQPAGRFAHAISIEAYRASNAYYEVAIGIASLVQIVVYVVAAVLISWQVAILSMFFGGAMMFALRGFVRMTRKASFHQNELGKSLVVRLTDALQGIKPIKAMARENQLAPLLEAETKALNKSQRHVILAKESLKAFQEPIMILVLSIGMYISIRTGAIPFSSLMVLAFLFYRLATRSNMLQQAYQKMTIYEAGFVSMRNGILQAERERELDAGKKAAPALQDAIVFDHVCFGYNPAKPIFQDLSFVIPAKSFTAIEGPSGSGKTTIADLMIGLMQPQSGVVLVDGINLHEVTLHEWRKCIGYVPQEMFLFNDTVYNNVALNDPSISRDAVEQALRMAGAWSFVEPLQDGIDSVLGERGSCISGGQRQRIALARALVGKPKLLILDEATTALDAETERGICETLTQLASTITIVAISHQPAMTEAADIVLRLEDGVITQKKF